MRNLKHLSFSSYNCFISRESGKKHAHFLLEKETAKNTCQTHPKSRKNSGFRFRKGQNLVTTLGSVSVFQRFLTTRWFKPWPFYPQNVGLVTFTTSEFGSRELTISKRSRFNAELPGDLYCLIPPEMDVSKNRGTPKWMVYNGKPY